MMLTLTLPAVNDLCFDISRFNSAAYKVSDFTESMIHLDKGDGRRISTTNKH